MNELNKAFERAKYMVLFNNPPTNMHLLIEELEKAKNQSKAQ